MNRMKSPKLHIKKNNSMYLLSFGCAVFSLLLKLSLLVVS